MAFSLFGILAVVLELFRPILPLLALIVMLDVLLFIGVILRRDRLRVRSGVRVATGIGIVFGLGAALLMPAWTHATLGQLSSVIDYLGVIGAGIGVGVAMGLLSYPPIQLLLREAR